MKLGAAAQPRKLRIMRMLMKGEMSADRVAKSVRMPKQVVESLLRDLVRDGLVAEDGGVYRITEDGEKALKSLR